MPAARREAAAGDTDSGGGRGGGIPVKYWEQLHTPETRDPRGYIIPSDQPDFLTATKFVNALAKSGIVIDRATRRISGGGEDLPGRIVRGEGGAGVPAAPARYVRAAGPS